MTPSESPGPGAAPTDPNGARVTAAVLVVLGLVATGTGLLVDAETVVGTGGGALIVGALIYARYLWNQRGGRGGG